MSNQFISGHEVEVAEIQAQKLTPEFRIAVLRNVAEMISGAANTLAAFVSGALNPTDSVFGEYSVEQQVADAELTLSRAAEILAKHLK